MVTTLEITDFIVQTNMKKLIVLFIFLLSTQAFAERMYYGLASFRCFNNLHRDYTEFWLRVKYKKTMGSEDADHSTMMNYIWHNARQFFEADTTTFHLHCGPNGAKGHLSHYDLTEQESLQRLETRFRNCKLNSLSKLCIDKSPLTAYHIPAFDDNIRTAQGDVNNDPNLCHGATSVRCMTAQASSVDFYIHYTFDKSTFPGNNCKTDPLTIGHSYYWSTFLPKRFVWAQNLVKEKLSRIVDMCGGMDQLYWSGAAPLKDYGYPSKEAAIKDVDKYADRCMKYSQVQCSRLTDFHLYPEDLQD